VSLTERLAPMPLVAILRGIRPEEAAEVALALVEAGFLCLEVPLNSPDPFASLRAMKDAVGDKALVGAGTVLEVADVARVRDAGGEIVISPNADPAVIAATKAQGMASMPAFFTPSEAFRALQAGADALKLFPAEAASPTVLKAVRAVLPKETAVFVVGGVTPDTLAPWRDAQAFGFGVGSSLYAPGRDPRDVATRAAAFVSAWRDGHVGSDIGKDHACR